MADIKFYKANALPASPTSANDGIWFIADGANNYKHFVITGGVVKELIVTGGKIDWSNLTDKKHLRYDSSLEKPVDSNMQDTPTGVSVVGDLMMPNISKEYIDTEETGRIAITKEWVEKSIEVNSYIEMEVSYVDDSYVWSNGVINGSSQNRFNYVRTDYVEISEGTNKIKFKRGTSASVFGCFYDEEKNFIGNIGGVGANLEGIIDVPVDAKYIMCNVSNSPSTRESDKMIFSLMESAGSGMENDYVSEIFGKKVFFPIGDMMYNQWHGYRMVSNGDSISVGVGANGQNFSFPNLTASALGMTITNYGVSGRTIAERESSPTERSPLVNNIASMRDDAGLIVIAAGTNDFNYSWTPFGDMTSSTKHTFYGALKLTCEQLLEKYVGKKIVFMTPIKRAQIENPLPDSQNLEGKTLKDYSDAIKEVCAFYGIDVLDMFSSFRLNPHIAAHASYFDGVKTHPTVQGQQIMARDLIKFLSSKSP